MERPQYYTKKREPVYLKRKLIGAGRSTAGPFVEKTK